MALIHSIVKNKARGQVASKMETVQKQGVSRPSRPTHALALVNLTTVLCASQMLEMPSDENKRQKIVGRYKNKT